MEKWGSERGLYWRVEKYSDNDKLKYTWEIPYEIEAMSEQVSRIHATIYIHPNLYLKVDLANFFSSNLSAVKIHSQT